MALQQSLAVKYRPKTLDDVVGQDSVKKIISNLISSDTFPNCILLSGASGSGKTTLARIIANSMSKGGVEIVEIDAASNNGVDDIRKISMDSQYMPMSSEYRVYIMDEVHMVTASGFAAMLKLIEEPPARTRFIMCTTDVQKLPITILSRVFRLNIVSLSTRDIISRLRFIVSCEEKEAGVNFDISNTILSLIATHANGNLRTSISLLESCLQYGSSLTLSDVYSILGDIPSVVFIDFIESFILGDIPKCIVIIDESLSSGVNFINFVSSLLAFIVTIRGMFLTQKPPEDLPEEVIPLISSLAQLRGCKLKLKQLSGLIVDIFQSKYKGNTLYSLFCSNLLDSIE